MSEPEDKIPGPRGGEDGKRDSEAAAEAVIPTPCWKKIPRRAPEGGLGKGVTSYLLEGCRLKCETCFSGWQEIPDGIEKRRKKEKGKRTEGRKVGRGERA